MIQGGTSIEFRILGSVEAVGDDGPIALGAPKQRALLVLLLLNANTVVSRDRLVDALWGADPPRSAVSSLIGARSQLANAVLPAAVRRYTRRPRPEDCAGTDLDHRFAVNLDGQDPVEQ